MLLKVNNICVKLLAHVFSVHKNESLFRVKTKSNYVFDITNSIFLDSFKGIASSKHKLLIISDLDDARNIKGFL
jgi:hypothetical protein